MKLIGLTGAAGCGKDTCADYLVKRYDFLKYNLALPIKSMIDDMLYCAGADTIKWDDREEKESLHHLLGCSPRRAAQTLGTEWGRTYLGEDIWLRLAGNFIDVQTTMAGFESVPLFEGIVIADIRFDNEASWLRARGGRLIHILRPGVAPVEAHISEAGVESRIGDVIVTNDGTIENMLEQVDAIAA